MVLAHTALSPAILSYAAPNPPAKEFEPPQDRAFFADLEKKSLLAAATGVKRLTPYIGTEVSGIQLSSLTDTQKDELALLVAERGVVFFRDQDITLEQQISLSEHYGVLCGPQMNNWNNEYDSRQITISGSDDDIREVAHYGADFHMDHSYQPNPPSYTILRMERTPECGGDTIWASQPALFDKLSKPYQTLLEGLHGFHSNEHPYLVSVNKGTKPFNPPVRRKHPLVRTHPVTKQKSLFYSVAFVIHLEELKGQEGKSMMDFLRSHIHEADDLSVRWRWEAGSIAFWDNRVVTHRAVPGGYSPSEREGHRTSVHGEVPFYDPAGETLSQQKMTHGVKIINNGVNGANGHAH